jgi:hypothetical protein
MKGFSAASAARGPEAHTAFMKAEPTPRSVTVIHGILLAALITLLALIVLVQSNPGKKTPARDYGFYAYIGDRILHGDLPYRDAWESKPPAIFYLNAVALWLGRGTRWGIWAVEMASLMTAIYASFILMRKLWGAWPALFGVLLWVHGLNLTLLGGNMTEEYPLPLHFLALILFLKLIETPARPLSNFLLGAVFAFSFLFRPNNAVTEAAVISTLLIAQLAGRNFRNLFAHLLWIGAGALLPMALTALYFWGNGLLQDLLDASILYNLTYSRVQLSAVSPLQFGFIVLGAGLWIAMAGYLLAAPGIRQPGRTRWLSVLLLIGWPMVIFLSDPARRNYVHYYMNWLPFMALLGGLAFHQVQSRLFPRLGNSTRVHSAGLSAALLLSAVFFVWNNGVGDYSRILSRLAQRTASAGQTRTPISTYVNEHTQPGEQVLFWGAYPGENFMSDRESPSGVLFYPLFVRSEISTRLNQRFLRELERNRPVLIVDMGDAETLSLDPEERARRRAAGLGWPYLPDNIDRVFAFIDQNYIFEARVKGLGVYRLKDAPSGTP